MRSPACCIGLVMDAVPNHHVILSSGHTPSHCKDQLPVKGFPQEIKDLPTLLSVGKIGRPVSATEMLAISLAILHVIVNDDGASIVTLAPGVLIHIVRHGTVGLIPCHAAKDGHANGAFGPFLVADQLEQAVLMILVRAPQHEDVVIVAGR